MSSTPTAAELLPPAIVAAIERQTGAKIVEIVPRAGAGASRQGAEVVLDLPGGPTRTYLSYDSRIADPARGPAFRREAAILAALGGPLAGSGVLAPPLLASEESQLALLTAFVPGDHRWNIIPQAEERLAVAQDLVAQIVKLHAVDATSIALDGFDDPRTPPSVRIRERIAALRADNLATTPDAILLLALDWLEANVPADDGPSVIVHGDAGASNFLHHEGKVSAMLDWELCHYGDPMEDLAQIWLRSMFNPFITPRQIFDAYEAAGGRKVDVARVLYHRLYFEIGFTVGGHAMMTSPDASPPAVIGTSLLFNTAHMRVIVEQLAEFTGATLPAVTLPDAPVSTAQRSFDIALDDLRHVIGPRVTDQQADAKVKSLARLVKWWKARERFGAVYADAEIAEVSAALGRPIASQAEARHALAMAVVEERVDPTDALLLCHARMVRETALMSDAMGAMRDCYFPPLD